jgi:hypothetical protein
LSGGKKVPSKVPKTTMPKDPYYSTPVKETKHGIFIRKPPKGGSPISIIINEGEFSSVERHHMIKIKQKQNTKNKNNKSVDSSAIASDFTISTDDETQQSSSHLTQSDEGRSTRREIQKDVDRIRGVKTTSKLKDGASNSDIPSVYQGVTLQTLGRVSSNISTSIRRRSRSRSRSRSDRHSSRSLNGMDDNEKESQNVKRVGGAVFKRVRSFSVGAKDRIRSRSRSIVRSLRKDKKEPKEKMVFVQQSYEEDTPMAYVDDVQEKGSGGFLGLGFLCAGFDSICGGAETEQNDKNAMKL